MRVAVGMSGGIDSSVAAVLLKRAGHDVTGVMMKLWQGPAAPPAKRGACFGPDELEDIEAARQVCARLGIPFSVFDCAAGFEDLVLRYFREEYLAGKTPNPCVRCNRLVKFGLLPLMARESGLDFESFATGHYARVEFAPEAGRHLLKKASDLAKDQSYFLYRLSQEQLSRTLFPLGWYTKSQVRRMAEEAELPVLDKRDSQDFYSGDFSDLLRQEDREGEIVDRKGSVLGRHRGVWNYTIGQRKGLGLSSPVPLYVIDIDAAANRLVVGPEPETCKRTCVVVDPNWIARERLTTALGVEVKIRSASKPVPALISPLEGGRTLVSFEKPVAAVTPGQSAVFYQDDIVLGGGVIESAAY
jgi:tRNA-specific 2-thiouridylase